MEGAIKHISVVRVKNSVAGDIVFSSEEWKVMGGYKGFVKEGAYVNLRDIEGIEYTTMDPREFAELGEWQG